MCKSNVKAQYGTYTIQKIQSNKIQSSNPGNPDFKNKYFCIFFAKVTYKLS